MDKVTGPESVERYFCINKELCDGGRVDCGSLGFQVPEREIFPVWEGKYLGITIFLVLWLLALCTVRY